MKEQFVTYEIALKLKELGFDEDCIGRFFMGIFQQEFSPENYPYKEVNSFHCPLWQQVIDWLREKYNLLIHSPKLDEWNDGKWCVKIESLDKSIILEEHVGQPYWRIYRCFKTFEESREQVILKAIELIKNDTRH